MNLPIQLHSSTQVDDAILGEQDKLVIVRFGHGSNSLCISTDELLCSIAEAVAGIATIYLVDTLEVPDFNKMYELKEKCALMFFYQNKEISIDVGGTGLYRKIDWSCAERQDMVELVESVHRVARKGRSSVATSVVFKLL
ncbi:Thioredoxin-like 4A [Chytriomyces hyalinus]|nr:Thioredoxin-like 4A [Chytriomyces hyalinus]